MEKLYGLFIKDCIRTIAGVVLRWPAPPGLPKIHHFRTQNPTSQETPYSWKMVGDSMWSSDSWAPFSPLASLQRSSFLVHPTFSVLHLLPDDLIDTSEVNKPFMADSVFNVSSKAYYLSLPGLNFPLLSKPFAVQLGCIHGSHQLKS